MEGPLRQLMPLFLLSMWGLFYWLMSNGTIGGFHYLLLALSLFVCLLVFVNFVHVFTFSYSVATLLLSPLIAVYFQADWRGYLVSLMLALYGLRLFYFQFRRRKADSYAGIRQQIVAADKEMPFFVKVILWQFTSWNYIFYSFAVYFICKNPASGSEVVLVFAAVIMLVGLVLETLADEQKQAFKKSQAGFCAIGLYQSCRHPNYFGEILFIFGVFLAGVTYCQNTYEVAAVLISPLYLVLLMIDASRRSDITQQQRYGEQAAYRQYRQQVPGLLPKLFK
ncbi:DUF1295 domain-containing protein [Oceanicoccus sp. KOV_DT_Chl]|uniref:DUF1295 domain-containing protein n=1 Tax=Oceanicoccus sp. KOV_DT_Chl TaxID=1904639 RepID=UPI000C79BF69|nr:DUF1295 domain-containing protein [Oceanicoccus sp. KOV_DT_Chl]